MMRLKRRPKEKSKWREIEIRNSAKGRHWMEFWKQSLRSPTVIANCNVYRPACDIRPQIFVNLKVWDFFRRNIYNAVRSVEISQKTTRIGLYACFTAFTYISLWKWLKAQITYTIFLRCWNHNRQIGKKCAKSLKKRNMQFSGSTYGKIKKNYSCNRLLWPWLHSTQVPAKSASYQPTYLQCPFLSRINLPYAYIILN